MVRALQDPRVRDRESIPAVIFEVINFFADCRCSLISVVYPSIMHKCAIDN
jgi:hypothetical protein